jgi:hypothetical protein
MTYPNFRWHLLLKHVAYPKNTEAERVMKKKAFREAFTKSEKTRALFNHLTLLMLIYPTH